MSRWYIIHAYSGFENKVRDAINSEATRMGLERFVEQIEVPTETVTEIKRGKKVQAERKFMISGRACSSSASRPARASLRSMPFSARR